MMEIIKNITKTFHLTIPESNKIWCMCDLSPRNKDFLFQILLRKVDKASIKGKNIYSTLHFIDLKQANVG